MALLYAADHPERGTPLQLCSTANEGQVGMQGRLALADPHSSQEQHALVLLPHTTGDLVAEISLITTRLALRECPIQCQLGQVPAAMPGIWLESLPGGALLAGDQQA